MTRATKSGKPAISKDSWIAMRNGHAEFADDLAAFMQTELLPLLDTGATPDVGHLTQVLLDLRAKHLSLAQACETLRAATRRGAPRRKPTFGPALTELIGKRLTGPQRDALMYGRIERRRAELSRAGADGEATVSEAIRSLIADRHARTPGARLRLR